MGPSRRVSSDLEKRIVELLTNTNTSVKGIAQRTGIHQVTVYDIKRRFGLRKGFRITEYERFWQC